MQPIKLGDRARDVITGFEGVVVGYVQYVTGCNQALLAPSVKEDGSLVRSEWFDDDRLTLVEADVYTVPVRSPGADAPVPTK